MTHGHEFIFIKYRSQNENKRFWVFVMCVSTFSICYIIKLKIRKKIMNPIQIPQNDAEIKNLPTLYVGDLEDYVTKGHLIKIFQQHGKIFNVSMMRKPGQGPFRGYAFVTFYSQQEALTALTATNHLRLTKRGKAMRVSWKMEKGIQDLPKEANIFIKNLALNLKEADLDQFFSAYGTIVSSTIRTDDFGCSMGYGYVQLSDPEDARKCIEKLNQNPNEIQHLIKKGHQAIIKTYESKQNRLDQMRDKTVFVFNLGPFPKKKNDLKSLFSNYGGIENANEIDCMNGPISIRFLDIAGADKCLSDNSLFSLPFRNQLFIKCYKYDQTHLSNIFGQELNFTEAKKYIGENDNDYCVLDFKDEQIAWNAHQKIRSTQLISLIKYRGLEMEFFGNVVISCHPKENPIEVNFYYQHTLPNIEETAFEGYQFKQLTFENDAEAENFMNNNSGQAYETFVNKYFELPTNNMENANNFSCGFEPARFIRKKNQVTKRKFDETKKVYLKNIDMEAKELKKEIESRGKFNVSSIRIGVNNNGDSLGCGYVIFSNEEEAKNFAASNVLKDEGIEVDPFRQHEWNENNSCRVLYCRGFPHQQEESEMLEKHLKQIFSEFGELDDKITLKFCEKRKQFFALIPFKLKNSALIALENLESLKENPIMRLYLEEKPDYENTHSFDERLYIDWSDEPKYLFYMLGIKHTCLPQDLERALSQFLGVKVKVTKIKCTQLNLRNVVKSAILKISPLQDLKEIEKLVDNAIKSRAKFEARSNLCKLLIDEKLTIKNYIKKGEKSIASMNYNQCIEYDLYHKKKHISQYNQFIPYPMMNQGFIAPVFRINPPMPSLFYKPFPTKTYQQ